MNKLPATLHPQSATKRNIGIGIAVCFVTTLTLTGVFIWHRPGATPPNVSAAPNMSLTYSIEGVDAVIKQKLETTLRSHRLDSGDVLQESSRQPDFQIISQPTDGESIAEVALSSTPSAITSGKILTPSFERIGLRSGRLSTTQRNQLKQLITQAVQSDPTWTYLALGDIIPARDVYTYSRQRGYLYPYSSIATRAKSADLTVSNLETTVADNQAFLQGEGVLNFTAPAAALAGLTEAGIDGVNLANNHSMNGGPTKVSEMLTNLSRLKIGSFGVGAGTKPAMWQANVKGIRVAHLGYDTVPGNIEPSISTPGAKRIPLKPWGALSQTDSARVQADVRLALQMNDVVIPWFHWGTEYTHEANDEQRALAHAAIDAGAEMVIGTHPHWTQGYEWYKGHLIAYSLGNFVFDQNWSEETKRSAALELTFSGKHVQSAQLLPAHIDNWVQPHFLETTSPVYKQILQDIADHSWWQ